MIVVSVIALDRRIAGRGAAVHEIAPGAERDCGHTLLGEGEVIRSKVPAGLGVWLRRHAQAERRRGLGELRLEIGAAAADQLDVARRGQHDVRIEVDHSDGLRERVNRVRGVVLGTEQSLLLGRPCGEHNGARRTRTLREDAGDLEHFRRAGGVVHRAVADPVALRVGTVAAIRVPVRAVQHIFAGGSGAGDSCKHVVTHDLGGLQLTRGPERRFLDREGTERGAA